VNPEFPEATEAAPMTQTEPDLSGLDLEWEYNNRARVPEHVEIGARWEAEAEAYRARANAELDIPYGPTERQRFDLFHPKEQAVDGTPLAVFIHGGYWQRGDRKNFSGFARCFTDRGIAVAMPSYDLAPAVAIGEITRQVASAIEKAAMLVDGPIRLSGHSAGGHLVTRMICRDSPLESRIRQRIERVVSISGLHDLRPLLKTEMNGDFRLDEAEAAAESAVLNAPIDGVELVCWVGADERPEFVRQADLLANIWTGFGLETSVVHEAGKHHFDVIDGLADAESRLVDALLR